MSQKGNRSTPTCIWYARVVIVLSILVLGLVAVCWPNAAEPEPAQQITNKEKAEEPIATESAVWEGPLPTYTAEELETLALVIYQEAGGDDCSDETRLMVGTVVLNRVADDRYPDTIAEVAAEYKQYGRLYWTGLKWPERADKAEEAHAVKRAYDCAERLLDGYRVLPADVIYQAEFTQGTEVVAQQDGFYFCR